MQVLQTKYTQAFTGVWQVD